jgi:signal transduction histidine kinase
MALEEGGQPEISDLAGAHANARLDAGFDLRTVVDEFALLRNTIYEVLERHTATVKLAEVKRLDAAIDETVSGSACRFAEARERLQATTLAREQDARALLDRTAVFREQFISVLAHDLRNPLQAIRSSADLLLRQESLHPGQVKGLVRINQSAERMARMISDVLDFARGRFAGGIQVERQRNDLFALCRDAVDELHVVNPARELKFEASGDGWGDWDPGRMAQAVSNLVGNALEHGAADSAVVLRIRGEHDQVLLEVHNRGEPIPQAILPRMFEPFRGTTSSDRRDEPRPASRGGKNGLGLGLWIVAQIVEGHGGTIAVRSSASEGTTFTVRLPRFAGHRAGVAAGGPQ